MRFFVSSIVIFSLLTSSLHAGKDFPFPIEEGFLVHVTKFPIKNSTAIPGAALDNKLVDISRIPEVRCTLHHMYHAMVPDVAMGRKISLGGIPIMVKSGVNQLRKYAFLDRFRNFFGHTFGGQLNDVFTGPHTYGKESFIIIPEGEESAFHKLNPGYEGVVLTYSEDEELRDVINRTLLENGGYNLEYRSKQPPLAIPNIAGFSVHLDDEQLDEAPFFQWFQERGLWIGNHNHSPFGHYETIMSAPREYFCDIAEGAERPWRQVPSLTHLEVVLSLYPFIKQQLLQEISKIPALTPQLIAWLESNDGYMNFFAVEAQLRKTGKSLLIDNPHFDDHFANRANLAFEDVDEQLEELSPASLSKIEGAETTGDKLFVPAYLAEFFSADPAFPRAFFTQTPLQLERKITGQLASLVRLYYCNKTINETFAEAVGDSLNDLAQLPERPSQKMTKYLQDEFWKYFKEDPSPGGEDVLRLLNHPGFEQLRALLLRKEGQKKPISHEVDFATLLTHVPGYDQFHQIQGVNHLFHLPWLNHMLHLPFLTRRLHQDTYTSIREAVYTYQTHLSCVSEFNITPLFLVHFCGDILDCYLEHYPAQRELTPYEKGFVISFLMTQYIELWTLVEVKNIMRVPPVQGIETPRDKFIKILIPSSSDAAGKEDELEDPSSGAAGKEHELEASSNDASSKESEPEKRAVLHGLREIVGSITQAPPSFPESPIPPAELVKILSSKINVLAMVRGGCFGGLRNVMIECGYGDQYDAKFGDNEEAAWFVTSMGILPPTFSNLILKLKGWDYE